MISFLFLACLLVLGRAKVVQGKDWVSSEKWNYFSKFCFASNGELTVSLTTGDVGMQFSSWTDTKWSWYSLEDDDTCETKESNALAKWLPGLNKEQSYATYFKSQRDRWWFFTISNCTHSPITIKEYKLVMKNPGGFFRAHFSANEFGIPEMLIIFTILSWGISGWAAYSTQFNLLPVGQFKLMRAVAMISIHQSIGFLLALIHYCIYANNGIGIIALKTTAMIVLLCTHVALMYIGLMVSRGWGVSDVVNLGFAPSVGIFCALVFVLEILIFIWYENFMDPWDMRDPMNTWPGWCLCITRIFAFFYLCMQVFRHTLPLAVNPESRSFYIKFVAIFGVWIFSLPICTLITLAVSDHFRTKVVFGLDITTMTLFYIAIILLFRRELSFRFTIDEMLRSPFATQDSNSHVKGENFGTIELEMGESISHEIDDVPLESP